jgi:DNA-binding NarL/FixJ family response regulator
MKRRRAAGPVGRLEDADQELLALVAQGQSDEAISEELGVDPTAVSERVGSCSESWALKRCPTAFAVVSRR